jgi:hypothetical protein
MYIYNACFALALSELLALGSKIEISKHTQKNELELRVK